MRGLMGRPEGPSRARRMRGIAGPARILLTMSHSAHFRTLALVLATVLLVVAATPARAEALEPLTIVAIASLVVAGILLVAYLIIANTEGERRADEGQVIWVAHTPES
jgi:hypothetical protein